LARDVEKKIKGLEGLLRVARALTIEKDLDKLLALILSSTTQVLHADRSSLFLYDEKTDELFSRIAQKEEKEIRFKADRGIAGAAARERKLINVKDPYADVRFNKEIDRLTGYRTRNILAAPLITHEDKLIGVVEAINKIGAKFFSEDDEALIEAFASHAALAIDNNNLIQHYLEKKKMEHALELAKKIQQDLLPHKAPEFAGLEVGSLSVPCDETGGDYFDYFVAGDRLFTVIGDVTGHGIGPALIMSETRALIHAITHTSKDVRADSVLTIANGLLAGDLTEGRFVTLFLGIFDRDRTLRFASGGHGNVYHFSSMSKKVTAFDPTGLPLGVMDDGTFGEKGPVTIERGDVVLFTTDGVEESMNTQGQQFGKSNIFDCLVRDAAQPASQIVEGIYRRLRDHMGRQPQRDDITMLAIKAL
jgi:phosphoserine phosphatase